MNESYACEHCGVAIPLADVNVSNDIALCRACGKTMPFSNIAPMAGAAGMDMTRPPKGVRFEQNPIRGKSILYKKISPVVFFLIPFTLVWSGFSMGGIYGSQIMSGEFNWVLSLFGLPFLIGTVVLVTTILFGLFGRWRITFRQGVMEAVAEIGPLGWTRRISHDRSARVSIKASGWSNNGRPRNVIQVESMGNVLKFGSGIPEEAMCFIAEAIRRTLTQGE